MTKKKIQFKNIERFAEYYLPDFSIITIEEAYQFCRNLATNHYENFFVVSPFLSISLRRFFYSIYSFARLCDDIADEEYHFLGKEERIYFLNTIESRIRNLKQTNEINNPILLALKDTIERNDLPLQPFLRLIEAFRRDVNFVQPKNFEDLMEYCSFSANPIGELVLYLFRANSEKTLKYSDAVCTALQLVNFWQDLSVDISRGRVYIPMEILSKYKLNPEDFFKKEKSEVLAFVLEDLFEFTQKFFDEGWKLVFYLSNRFLKFHVQMYILGGLEIFHKEIKYSSKLFYKRPKLNFFNFLNILFQNII